MRITDIKGNNFKSLVDFHVALPKFTCLIGLNGAGKSTLLQFIDFLAQQMRGDLKGWLTDRQWRATDLHSHFSTRKNIDFALVLESDQSVGAVPDRGALGEVNPLIEWSGSFNTAALRCTSESLQTPRATLRVKDGRLGVYKHQPNRTMYVQLMSSDVAFEYQGSALSQLRPWSEVQSLFDVRDYFANIRSLDLLAPQYLRQRTRASEGSLGLGGQKLSSFVYEMGQAGRSKLATALHDVYTNLEAVEATPLRSGWKQLRIAERFNGRRLETEARHVSDGMLRLIAILSELQSNHPLLLFDEIENGINPELVEFVIGSLVAAPQQVIVTTHSPLILNYLDDDVAREGVIYVYRRPDGLTRCIPFFSIPSLAEKLTVMGPGEAFADTDLTRLGEEISRMPEAQ